MHFAGARPEDGVPDMTVISEIDEYGINTNLKVRYNQSRIYVSCAATTTTKTFAVVTAAFVPPTVDIHWNNPGRSQSIQAPENI